MPTKADIIDFLVREFPQSSIVVEEVGDCAATVSHPVGPAQSRYPIVGVCKLIKVGRILVIGEVALFSDRNEQMVAHAVGTYSIPPQRSPAG
jgi:acyl-coenzyme A thioesterase PaaI-like protein